MSEINDSPWADSELFFVIPGPFVSGNHAKTKDGRRTSEAREFDTKVRLLCGTATRLKKWLIPDYVHVSLHAVNVLIDADNLAKEILDPMQGLAFAYDSRVLTLKIKRYKDDREPRVVVRVWEASGSLYGWGKPRRKKKAAPA